MEKIEIKDKAVMDADPTIIDVNGNSSNVQFLVKQLHTPILSLLEEYLWRSNGDGRKSPQKCLFDFRIAYPKIFLICFLIDAIIRLGAVWLIVLIFLRWIGIVHI